MTEAVRPAPREALELGGVPALVHAVHLMAQATDGLRHQLAAELGINGVDVTALVHLYNHPDIRPTDLGRAVNMGSAGLTALADRLEKAGLLRRRPDPNDRRGTRLRLSSAGFTATAWVYDAVSGALRDQLSERVDNHGVATGMAEVLVAVSQALEAAQPTQGPPSGPAAASDVDRTVDSAAQ